MNDENAMSAAEENLWRVVDVGQMRAFAAQRAESFQGGEVLALCGELGAGKTHFTQGLASGLGIDASAVTSPTFTLVHEYGGGRLPIFHFDFYRMESADEVLAIGWEEYLDEPRGVVVVEWANKFPELLPPGGATQWWSISAAADEGAEVRVLRLSDDWEQAKQ
jgi:tRNA threonylcarbamoyladenosine biosynthesis protein TsaE